MFFFFRKIIHSGQRPETKKRVTHLEFGDFPGEMKEMKASRKLLALIKLIKVNFTWQRRKNLEIRKMILKEREISSNSKL